MKMGVKAANSQAVRTPVLRPPVRGSSTLQVMALKSPQLWPWASKMLPLAIVTPFTFATHTQEQLEPPGRLGSADAWSVAAAATKAVRIAILKDARKTDPNSIAISRVFSTLKTSLPKDSYS